MYLIFFWPDLNGYHFVSSMVIWIIIPKTFTFYFSLLKLFGRNVHWIVLDKVYAFFFSFFFFYYIKNPQKKQEPSVPKRVFSVFICGAFIFPLEELKLCTWFIMFLSHCFISGVSQRQTRVFNVVQGRLHTSKPLHNHSTESNQICTFPFLRTQVMHLLFILW
jgi:hypothetical protein